MRKKMRWIEKLRTDRQHKNLKQQQKEWDQQFNEETVALARMIEYSTESKEEALIALQAWIDKWMDKKSSGGTDGKGES